ncbi:motility-associated protein [Vibrio alginolyticus]|uniref:motility-associated protein n=1 Tax=Vibrio TaxID=662 RepID=UPI0006CA647A|nr:motility-associated protein [Vibrio alginolyticus]KPM98582.1 hypothetical protein AOG25_09095 [Vibrio alginolyticus]CAH7156683.1 Flagellar motor rotation protein MotA [Vibrio chagasii]CAH7326451.1 Flagellar motor rotation protein MotA [Vibrio chagasii]
MQVLFFLMFTVASLVGGFALAGGYLKNLWQPYEIVMIGGAGIGFFFASNTVHGIKMFGRYIGYCFKKPFCTDKFSQSMGLLVKLHKIYEDNPKELAKELEDPSASQIFNQYPLVLKDSDAVKYIANNLNTIIDEGADLTPFDYEDIFEAELEQYSKEAMMPYKSMNSLVDTFPALGIAAAVMGIIIAMQFLDAGMMKLGAKIGAALFGTFFGVFMAYGICKPFALKFAKFGEETDLYYGFLRSYLLCIAKRHSSMKAPIIANRDIPPRYKLDTNVLREKLMKEEL